jgi:hypothetical protein
LTSGAGPGRPPVVKVGCGTARAARAVVVSELVRRSTGSVKNTREQIARSSRLGRHLLCGNDIARGCYRVPVCAPSTWLPVAQQFVEPDLLACPGAVHSLRSPVVACDATGGPALHVKQRLGNDSHLVYSRLMETEPSARLSDLREFARWPAKLRRFRWLGTLLRLEPAIQGGAAVSEGNGNDGAAHTNGHTNGDLEALIIDAVQQGIESVERQDPLSKENKGPETWLLIGAQKSYDPAIWSPDPRASVPGSPERQEWEADPNPITALDDEVQEVFGFLAKLDEPSGFNDPN